MRPGCLAYHFLSNFLMAKLSLFFCLLLVSCSPTVRVARHYKRFAHSYRKELRKPLHNLPLK